MLRTCQVVRRVHVFGVRGGADRRKWGKNAGRKQRASRPGGLSSVLSAHDRAPAAVWGPVTWHEATFFVIKLSSPKRRPCPRLSSTAAQRAWPTLLPTTKRLMALSLGTMAALVSHRTRFTCRDRSQYVRGQGWGCRLGQCEGTDARPAGTSCSALRGVEQAPRQADQAPRPPRPPRPPYRPALWHKNIGCPYILQVFTC